jgi:hypothetical protein
MEHFTAGRPIVLAEATGGAIMESGKKTRTKSFPRLRSCLRHAYVSGAQMEETSSFKTTERRGLSHVRFVLRVPSSTATLRRDREHASLHPRVVEVRAV